MPIKPPIVTAPVKLVVPSYSLEADKVTVLGVIEPAPLKVPAGELGVPVLSAIT